MSSDDLDDFFVHEVAVETYLGKAGNGTILYGASTPSRGFLSRKQRFVRDANGETVTSSASYSTDVDQADLFAPKSRVTIPGQAQPTTVISREVPTGGTFIEGIDRVKVYLQ